MLFMYSIMSLRSFCFFMPAKPILFPGRNFLGFSRNLSKDSSFQMMFVAFRFAIEYAKPGTVPATLPKILYSEGPVVLSPRLMAWHCGEMKVFDIIIM